MRRAMGDSLKSGAGQVLPKLHAYPTNLHQAQALQAFLHQFLYLTFLRRILVLTEGVSCLPTSILPEVVVGELAGIPQQGAELRAKR